MLARSGGLKNAAIAYFDAEGCLLGLYADLPMKEYLRERGITERTVWTERSTGNNAVTMGFRHERELVTAGADHACPALQGLVICFVPLRFRHVEVGELYHLPEKLGGIAVLAREGYAAVEYRFLASAVAHDIEMTMHFNQSSIRQYERQNTGILIVDTRLQKGQPVITYANSLLFEALGQPARRLDFEPLETLFKRETNEKFYELLGSWKQTGELSMTLEAGGKRILCLISCDIYDQPSVDAGGLTFYITTPQLESRKVAHKMGNAAVLSFSNVIGECPQVKSAIRRATLISRTDSNVMILGESGVGKDVFAQAIHNASSRRDKPFIAVNCAALPKDLIASELFGYDSGAFTGAKKNGNMGKFELANGGTIFLDEVGDLPLDLQATLLRVVEQKQLMRLGSSRLIDVDVKIISATNADIPHLIEQKLFRSDLFFRLGTLKLTLPPLRKRGRDIVLLANHFVQSISRRLGRSALQEFSLEAEELLMSLPWTGNVRELQNVIECIVQLYPETCILPEHILENINIQLSFPSVLGVQPSGSQEASYIKRPGAIPRRALTREDIVDALERCGNNRSEAAKYLGIARKTLYRNMERLGMS
jgi:DNA-binding NtrC family response regulator